MGQVPSGAEGTTAGVLVYSVLCLLASAVMIWLTWHHRERTGYIAFLAYFTFLSTLCSVVQQVHGLVRWRAIVEEQFYYMREHAGSPELVISNSAVGLDLILYYIQFYAYNVEALLVMFWGWALVQSVYQLTNKPKLKQALKVINRAGLGFSICFPIITVSSLQADVVRSNTQVFMLLAGQPLLWSIGIGSVALLLVFVRYVHSQRKFKRFALNVEPSDGSNGTLNSRKRRTMYDRWLVIRFTIAFIIMAAFELTIVLFSMSAEGRISDENKSDTPDFSTESAQNTFLFFMPGVTPSLLLFVVFATTKPCIEYMKSCFIRKRRESIMIAMPNISPPIMSPKTLSPTLTSPTMSARSYDIQKPQNAYYGRLRDDRHPYMSHQTRAYMELREMKPLPPTPDEREFLSSKDVESGFASQTRLIRPR